VRNHISGHDIANTVRMAHSQRRITFLLVEGESDFYTLIPFLLAAFCEILVCHAKLKVLAAVSGLDRTREAGFLAIVDADFDHIEGRASQSPNCILTEFHDLEVILLCSSALDKVLRERASSDKLRAFEEEAGGPIRDVLFDRVQPLGRLRLANERGGWGLRFDGLNYSGYFDRDSLSVDLDRMIQAVVQRSSTGHRLGQVRSDFDAQVSEAHDLRLLCTGHDVVAVIGIALRKAIGTAPAQEVAPEALERELRLAFDREAFLTTQIYTALRDWEHSNPEWRVLAPTERPGQ